MKKPDADERGGRTKGHLRFYNDLLDSPAFAALSPSACKLLLDLGRQAGANNNGVLAATLQAMRLRGWHSSATLSRALKELEAAGFIRATRRSIGVVRGSKLCNLYRLTDRNCYEIPKRGLPAVKATNEWEDFKTVAEAKAAIRAALQKKTTLQKLNYDASETEPSVPFDASETERLANLSPSKTEASGIIKFPNKRNRHNGLRSSRAVS